MTKTTLLIVEDQAIIAADLAGKLNGLGYHVAGIAASGEQAIAMASRLRPHLVLMDIWLESSLDGIAAAEAIGCQGDVPVIYLTAHSDPATLARAKLTGPFGYILKPFDERELATQIELALHAHRADQQLRQQREWLRATLSSIGEGVIATDAAGQITFLNPVAESLTGWNSQEAVGQPLQRVLQLVNEQTGQTLEDPVAQVLHTGHAVEWADHAAMLTEDGQRTLVEHRAAPILDATRHVMGAVMVLRDVTEKRQLQEQLKRSRDDLQSIVEQRTAERAGMVEAMKQEVGERAAVQEAIGAERQRFEDVLNLMPAYVVLLAPDRRVSFANRFFKERFGNPDDPRCCEFFVSRTGPREQRNTYKVLETIAPRHWEWSGPQSRDYDVYDFPFPAADGTPVILEVGLDITERKQAATAAQAERRQFFDVLETLPTMICLLTDDCHIAFANRNFREKFGESRDRRCHGSSLRRPKTCKSCEIDHVFKTGRPHHWEITAADGSVMDARAYPFTDVDGSPMVLEMDIDITDRRKSEMELARYHEHLEELVKERTARIEAANLRLQAEIAERQQAEEAMAAAKVAAETANEAKSQFLANMSHELRTPMNAILGLIDLALPKASDPMIRDCLQTAKGSADLLLTLLNDLLDSAKTESGKLELESAPFSLWRMLDQLTRSLSVRASEKGLCFSCRMPDNTPDAVVGDRMRLEQVLLNLAGNAIKFTERGDVQITLHARPQGAEVSLEFAVRDTGIGIPPSGLEHLFEPFAQANASTARRFGGTGLGLSICKSLVELMGGRIWVESEPGQGSTFYFSVCLPLAKEIPVNFEAPVAAPTATCAPLRILLVEDNAANQKLATYVLQERGHLVEIAGDGQEAVYLTEQNPYDVIIMDVQMPDMNGLEATAAIRKREGAGRRVPIIAMTAHVMKGDRDRCLAAGMDGYLSKPVNAPEMIGLVESLAHAAVLPAQHTAITPIPAERSPQTAASSFNPDEALTRCFHSTEMVRTMIECFFDEAESLLPQMRAALHKGDLIDVGRLGHRLKGTVVYLGAKRAKEAAYRVEQLGMCNAATASEAEVQEAVKALEHECKVLKAALKKHLRAAKPLQHRPR
ncbi:MAG: response regulator [Pirellulaceae bacterium]